MLTCEGEICPVIKKIVDKTKKDANGVGTKGVSQNHLLSFDDNKVLKIINWIC